jgi:UDP-glucose 4-epimerase
MINKILVTGGAGYIGSHVTDLLVKKGYDVIVYDNFSEGSSPTRIKKSINIIKGDILDIESLTKALDGVSAVVHCAAKKSVGESAENPIKYYENNFVGTINVLKAMKQKNIKNIILSSSAAVYSDLNKDLIHEDDETNPISIYGFSKLLSEKLLLDLDINNEIKFIILRYFNVAGTYKPSMVDSSNDNLIPRVIESVVTQTQAYVYGRNYNTPDGTCIRDYIHVSDVAKAHLSALTKLELNGNSSIYNIGSGVGHSVQEIFSRIESITGHSIKIVDSQPRIGDPIKVVAAIKKAEVELSWKPDIGIDEIINSAWKAKLIN